jgi:hypothetical protein
VTLLYRALRLWISQIISPAGLRNRSIFISYHDLIRDSILDDLRLIESVFNVDLSSSLVISAAFA